MDNYFYQKPIDWEELFSRRSIGNILGREEIKTKIQLCIAELIGTLGRPLRNINFQTDTSIGERREETE